MTLLFQMVIHEAVLTMDGDGPGQRFLDLIERHAAGEDVPCRCRFRRAVGWEHHFLAVNDDSWVRVRSR